MFLLVGKLEVRRPLWGPRSRWKGNIKMYVKVVVCQFMDWISVASIRGL
jgi:hypothetical protein